MGQPEEPNFHGMVLVGEKRAYLYHLPMFHSPHDYQAIFEVSLTSDDADVMPAYRRDRMDNPPGGPSRPNADSRMYGFAPTIDLSDANPLTDLFILSDLVTPADPHDPTSPPIREAFMGTIFRGHFLRSRVASAMIPTTTPAPSMPSANEAMSGLSRRLR